tara:strand:- start:717 stop:1232 length:516 start_codon:yes stop_codon:yes gene_type:complete
MPVLAIDPGTTESAYCVVADDSSILAKDIMLNDDLCSFLYSDHIKLFNVHLTAIEMIACYGMPVGRETFETCVWIGRFVECITQGHAMLPIAKVFRKDIKLHLCNSARAKDANVRQAILDMYSPIGGGKTPQIGTKKNRGPLYGVRSHIWAALAAAIYYQENRGSELISYF